GGDEIFVGQNSLSKIDIDAELLIDLVTAYPTEVVLLRIEKQTLQERTRIRHSRRIAGAQTTVNIFECLFLIVCRIFADCFDDGVCGSRGKCKAGRRYQIALRSTNRDRE